MSLKRPITNLQDSDDDDSDVDVDDEFSEEEEEIDEPATRPKKYVTFVI